MCQRITRRSAGLITTGLFYSMIDTGNGSRLTTGSGCLIDKIAFEMGAWDSYDSFV